MPEGLSTAEATRRLKEYGYNEISKASRTEGIKLFLSQFKDVMIFILIVALVISAVLGETIDSIAIGVVVILNGILGFVQQYRAERAVEALRELASPRARVLRDGKIKEIESKQIVPGDLVLIDTGDKIPADLVIKEGMNLMADESSLTGESVPVEKDQNFISDESTPLAERKNFLFMGTTL